MKKAIALKQIGLIVILIVVVVAIMLILIGQANTSQQQAQAAMGGINESAENFKQLTQTI